MNIIKPTGASLVSISGASDVEPIWHSDTSYDTGSRVRKGGFVYVSSIDGNIGKDPELELQEREGARWILVGAQNTSAFMDGSQSVKTVGESPMVIEVEAQGFFNSIALLDLNCSSCKVELINGGEAREVKTIRTGAQGVGNWWDWLYTQFYKDNRRHIVYGAAGAVRTRVRLTIIGPKPWLGEMVLGTDMPVGSPLLNQGTKSARRTFTKITTNDFGTTTVQRRAAARDTTYQVHAKRQGFEAVERLLDDLDGVRVVTYAVKDDWPQLINAGFLTDYVLPAELPDDFVFSITTQGVT